jgi:alpha-ketoglutarate-dependent taurine dioxygenase
MNALFNHEEKHGFALHHLSPVIGTEVHGIDIGADLDEEVITFLSDLLVQRKVLFFASAKHHYGSAYNLCQTLR